MVVLVLCFVNSFSEIASSQQKRQNSIQADSASTKQKTPSKQTRKQKAQLKKVENKEIKLPKPEPWQNDRTLLMKEKDSLEKKTH